jgi:hypothetical protein
MATSVNIIPYQHYEERHCSLELEMEPELEPELELGRG